MSRPFGRHGTIGRAPPFATRGLYRSVAPERPDVHVGAYAMTPPVPYRSGGIVCFNPPSALSHNFFVPWPTLFYRTR